MLKTVTELNELKKDELVALFLQMQEQASKDAEEASAKLKDAQDALTTANEEISKARQVISEQQGELDESLKLVAELNEKLSNADKAAPAVELPTVKIGKKEFVMTVPKASYKGQDVTIEILQEDAELAKKLVEIGVGYLTEKEA